MVFLLRWSATAAAYPPFLMKFPNRGQINERHRLPGPNVPLHQRRDSDCLSIWGRFDFCWSKLVFILTTPYLYTTLWCVCVCVDTGNRFSMARQQHGCPPFCFISFWSTHVTTIGQRRSSRCARHLMDRSCGRAPRWPEQCDAIESCHLCRSWPEPLEIRDWWRTCSLLMDSSFLFHVNQPVRVIFAKVLARLSIALIDIYSIVWFSFGSSSNFPPLVFFFLRAMCLRHFPFTWKCQRGCGGFFFWGGGWITLFFSGKVGQERKSYDLSVCTLSH